MINDKMENLLNYIPQGKKNEIERFLLLVKPEMDEKRYEIDGNDIFAMIMSYNGKCRKECRIEAHDQYVDIQFTLIGKEKIELYERKKLKKTGSYNKESDVIFFDETEECYLSVSNCEGFFTMIFPNEAHCPQIMVNEYSKYIKKGVIKIKESLFV